MLSFQRLDVYQRAIEFLALVGDVVAELPRGHAERSDQLVRAAESVVRNIAEGAGRWSDADSAKQDNIARGRWNARRPSTSCAYGSSSHLRSTITASAFSKPSSRC